MSVAAQAVGQRVRRVQGQAGDDDAGVHAGLMPGKARPGGGDPGQDPRQTLGQLLDAYAWT